MTRLPYSYRLETLPISDKASVPTMHGHAPTLLYRYWADGESEWIVSPGQPNESVYASCGEDPWEAIKHLEALTAAPDAGVCVGYLAYELGVRSVLERSSTHCPPVPLVHLGVYLNNQCRNSPQPPLILRGGVKKPSPRRARLIPEPTQDKVFYKRALERIKTYLEAGDIYQANYTQVFNQRTPLAAQDLYARLCAKNPAPYAAYLDCGDFHVLSSSPECFLKIRDREISTLPIKGTLVRGKGEADDARHKAYLLASAKDGAELLMICDLERNDLGRVCVPGSVTVDALKEIQTFSTLHHLVSRISGQLRANTSPIDALRACFPGGSITGAPKKRAMEIIDALEPHARGVYTGCIGYFGRKINGTVESQWNIAIRTLVVQDGLVSLGSGGGITVDSNPDAEYEESLLKARALKEAVEG